MRGFGASSEAAIVFRTRYPDGFTLADRVVYAGRIHDIKELKELGRRQGLQIRTTTRGGPGARCCYSSGGLPIAVGTVQEQWSDASGRAHTTCLP